MHLNIMSNPGRTVIKLTVTRDGVVRLKVPSDCSPSIIELFKSLAEQVIRDNFGVTMRGRIDIKYLSVGNGITMYSDNQKICKTYIIKYKDFYFS